MATRHLVVDGSNIATEGRSLPSLKQLDEAVRAFLEEYPHGIVTVVVDATFEHRIDPSERKLYDDALDAGELITPPAGTIGRGDKFLLEIANRAQATVLSNDSFQEFHGEYDWLFDEGRLIGGKPVPEVGWIFTIRTPVRGPRSRRAVQAASKKAGRKSSSSAPKKAATRKAASRSPKKESRAPVKSQPAPTAPAEAPDTTRGEPRGRRRGKKALEPVNEPLAFIEFIAEHPVGSVVEGEVDEFSSHGAYVRAGGARCYIPLRFLGDPAPRSAREVLNRNEVRPFVVQALDPTRRGIDLALPGFADIEPGEGGAGQDLVPEVDQIGSEPATAAADVPRRRQPRSRKAATAAEQAATADQAPAAAVAEPSDKETTTDTTPAKKTAARKATAKKSTAKRTGATAKKTAAASKSTAKSTAKKAAAKRGTAKKSARKAPAKKGTAKSAARKSTAKKSTAKKATTKKAPAKKATAKKATTKKAAGTKKAGGRSTAKKSPAKRATKR